MSEERKIKHNVLHSRLSQTTLKYIIDAAETGAMLMVMADEANDIVHAANGSNQQASTDLAFHILINAVAIFLVERSDPKLITETVLDDIATTIKASYAANKQSKAEAEAKQDKQPKKD